MFPMMCFNAPNVDQGHRIVYNILSALDKNKRVKMSCIIWANGLGVIILAIFHAGNVALGTCSPFYDSK